MRSRRQRLAASECSQTAAQCALSSTPKSGFETQTETQVERRKFEAPQKLTPCQQQVDFRRATSESAPRSAQLAVCAATTLGGDKLRRDVSSARLRALLAVVGLIAIALATGPRLGSHVLVASGALVAASGTSGKPATSGGGGGGGNGGEMQRFEVLPDAQYFVAAGGELRMRCLVRNRQGECFWMRNGKALGPIIRKYAFSRTPDDGDCSLQLRNASVQADDGRWQCQVTAGDLDQETLQSREFSLTVLVAPERPSIKNTVSIDCRCCCCCCRCRRLRCDGGARFACARFTIVARLRR